MQFPSKNPMSEQMKTRNLSVNTAPVLMVKNLTRRFGKFTAVDGISFVVHKGEVFGLLGANGAGKTTTIRMICGLLEPTEGEIVLDGISVNDHPDQAKKRIGYMSQKFSLYMDLTPRENLEFFGRIYEVPKDQLEEEIIRMEEELNIRHHPFILTRDLPLGHKQRLALRISVLHNPSILFLDEATSGVDPAGRREFWDRIYTLSEEGKTIIVTTHYMDEAEYCQRLVIMDRGKIVQEGNPTSLKQKLGVSSMQDVFIRSIRI